MTSGGDRYAIPQVSLLELVRLEGEQARKGIEMIHGAPVYRLRGHLLPLVYLKRELGAGGNAQPQGRRNRRDFERRGAGFCPRRAISTSSGLSRLRQFLDGKTSMTVEQAGSHKECALGKWLYSLASRSSATFPEMQELEKTYAGFHALVKQIVTLKTAGHHAQAEQELRACNTHLRRRSLTC